MLFLLAAGCVGHDQLRLKDPSPCHMQCQYNAVAQLDPECHGYHPTCWIPWAATCPGCPPPPSGVYPIMEGPMGPEPVPPPQPVLKTPQQKLPPPETTPAPTEPTPALQPPAAPSEPTPAPTETPPPAEGTVPGEGMPAPGSNPIPPETTPTMPDLPPLVPPGRELPNGSPPKDRDSEPRKKNAMLETALPESNLCQQAAPLGTIAEVSEPAKLEQAPAQPMQQEVASAGAPPSNSPPSMEKLAEGEVAAAPMDSAASVETAPNENSGVVQAVYQAIVPSTPEDETDAASDEAAPPDDTFQTDETAEPEETIAADSAAEHGPISRRLGGILIVVCSLACGGLYLKSLMGQDDELAEA